MKVLVGIPLTSISFKQEFRRQVKEAIRTNLADINYCIIETETVSSGLKGVVEALNKIVTQAVNEQYDYIWIVEADVIPPPKAFISLMLHKASVALGCYPYHVDNGLLMAGYFLNDNPQHITMKKLSDLPVILNGQVWAGIGCALIETKVFSSGLYFVLTEKVGHDLYWLFHIQKRGFQVVVDMTVKCQHLS